MQNQIKIVCWNASGASQGSIASLLPHAWQQKVDVIFLQNVDIYTASELKSNEGYALLSVMPVSPTQQNPSAAYVVYYNPKTLATSDRGYLLVPSQPANADQFQEARICKNAFSQIQLQIKNQIDENPEVQIAKANLQYALVNQRVAESNADFARAIEQAMITVLAAKNPPTTEQKRDIDYAIGQVAAYQELVVRQLQEATKAKETRGKLGTSTNEASVKVEAENKTNDGSATNSSEDQPKQTGETTSSSENIKGNRGLFEVLKKPYQKVMDYKQAGHSITDTTLQEVVKQRPTAREFRENTEATLHKARQIVASYPKPRHKQLTIFNWSAPTDTHTPDGQNYGLYAFHRTLKFFQYPDGQVQPGSGLVTLGAFNVVTPEMRDTRGRAFRNMVSASGNFGDEEVTNHMVNFNEGVGELIKDYNFGGAQVAQNGSNYPFCAFFRF